MNVAVGRCPEERHIHDPLHARIRRCVDEGEVLLDAVPSLSDAETMRTV